MNIQIIKKTDQPLPLPQPGQFWRHVGSSTVYQRIDINGLKAFWSFKDDPNYFYSINIKTGSFEYTENIVPPSLEIIILEPVDNTLKFKEI
jgi:hypothetical protein